MGIFSKKPAKSNNNQNLLSSMVLNAIHDGVLIIDPTGTIKLCNPAAAQIINLPCDEIIGLHFTSVLHLADRNGNTVPEDQNPITQAFRTHKYSETKKFDIVHPKTNQKIPVWLSITPTDDPSSDLVITFRNIAKELKEDQERTEFISTASHEMRTPVASIEGYLGLALSPQTATIDDRARAYLTKAHEASQHLGQLFQDLLDTTKLDDGKMKINPEPVEMNSLIKNIADGMAPNIAAKGLQYSFDSAASSVKLQQIIYCSLDVNFLREIINNIIENAIKYTAKGSIKVSVTGNPDNAIIAIADSGIGISRDDQDHIFQKFYRADNSDTRTIGGNGLGLYITKQRVEAMNGHIWVESQPGKGTTFFISFPRISSEEYERQKLAATSIMQPTPKPANPNPPVPPAIPVPPSNSSPPSPPPTPASSPPATPPPPPASTASPPAPANSQPQPEIPQLSPQDLAWLKQQFSSQVQTQDPNHAA